MRTYFVALTTALLLCTGNLLKAQPIIQLALPGFLKVDTVSIIDSTHTKRTAVKKVILQNISTSLGYPAGQKLAGNSKREMDSLQQIMLLRKKF